MKGLVFTEFLEMVEEAYSPEMVEKIISASHLKTKGAYTSVGTYDYREMVELITHLSQLTNTPIPELEKTYGRYLFKKLVSRYPDVISSTKNAFECLKSVDDNIHVEVRKLYPDAELPHFKYTQVNSQCLIMDYFSTRPFSNLAEGLMLGCIEHYKENISIHSQTLTENGKSFVRFTLKRLS